jgi:hypothetical protein
MTTQKATVKRAHLKQAGVPPSQKAAAAKKAAGKTVKKAVAKKSTRRPGRPEVYTKELANQVLQRLSDGESLSTIGKDPTMPSITTIYAWLNDSSKEWFVNAYARAREAQASLYAAEIIDIADDAPMIYFDMEGNERVDGGYVQMQKLRIDARKWYAGKVAPTKYGDKVDVNVGGQAGNPLTVLYEEISGNGFIPKDPYEQHDES